MGAPSTCSPWCQCGPGPLAELSQFSLLTVPYRQAQAIEASIHSALPHGRWQLRCGGHHRCSGAALLGGNTTVRKICFALLSSHFQVKPTHSLHTTTDKLSRHAYTLPCAEDTPAKYLETRLSGGPQQKPVYPEPIPSLPTTRAAHPGGPAAGSLPPLPLEGSHSVTQPALCGSSLVRALRHHDDVGVVVALCAPVAWQHTAGGRHGRPLLLDPATERHSRDNAPLAAVWRRLSAHQQHAPVPAPAW